LTVAPGAGQIFTIPSDATLNIMKGGAVLYNNACEIGSGGAAAFNLTLAGRFETGNWVRFTAIEPSTMGIVNGGGFTARTINDTGSFVHTIGAGHTLFVTNAFYQVFGGMWLGGNDVGHRTAHRFLLDIQNGGHGTNMNNLVIGQFGTNNTVRVRAGGRLAVMDSYTIQVGSNAAAPNQPAVFPTTGNALLPAGGAITANNLNVLPAGILAPEIQANGFGEDCGLAEIRLRGTATFSPGAILRPSAVKGAPGGTYRVLNAPIINAVAEGNILFEPAETPGVTWDWGIDRSTPNAPFLWVKLLRTGTLFLVK
jgi:hypothetical protein